MAVLIDSNIILDVFKKDPVWFEWSSNLLLDLQKQGNTICINSIVYGEVSIQFETKEKLDRSLPETLFKREPLPYEAAFLAGKCYMQYKKRGGTKNAPLPDFYIGAHADVMNWTLATRDVNRYKTYFPNLKLITPTN